MTQTKTQVRAQYDHRANTWRIVKQTNIGSGGWAKFGTSINNTFASREQAEKAVNDLVKMYKGTYEIG